MLSRILGIRIFEIEATNRCNLHCRFCPRELLPDLGLMSMETFKAFLHHVKLKRTDTVSFVGMGEPLLNPKLPAFIEAVKDHYPGTRTWVTTNGTLMTPEYIERLLAAGLDTLDVSFNGLNQQAYESLMCGACFEKTLANIEAARALISRTVCHTRLQINVVLNPDDRIEEIQEFWRDRGIENLRLNRIHNRAGRLDLPDLTSFDRPGLDGNNCEAFLIMPFITWKGEVLYCSHDIERRYRIGSVVAETWKTIQRRRQKIAQCDKWPSFCRACTDSRRCSLRSYLNAEIRKDLWCALRRFMRRPAS